jgi:hypothetical protein
MIQGPMEMTGGRIDLKSDSLGFTNDSAGRGIYVGSHSI